MKEFRGRVAVVTGAASGIGLGMAKALCAEGARVVLADIEQAPLTEATAQLRDSGADVTPVCCDVANEASMDALRDRGQLRFAGAVHFGDIVSGAVPSPNGFTRDVGGGAKRAVATMIDSDPLSATYGHGTFTVGWEASADGAIQEYNVEILNAPNFTVGAISAQNRADSSTRPIVVGNRVYDRENNTIIPMGSVVSAT